MTIGMGADSITPGEDIGDVLSRVRQLDPTSEDSAVRGYIREMEEADAILNAVTLGDAPLQVCFSALWSEGSGR
jgi:hypothetical protein